MDKDLEGLYEGPSYAYFRCDYSTIETGPGSMTEALRDGTIQRSVEEAYSLLYEVLEEEGPFDGVIGFSHGATLAFGFLTQHAEKNPLDPPFALFRCAIFISGPSPLREDGTRLRYDERVGPLLKIPTLHIAGKTEILLPEILSLYGMCEKHTAKLVVHENGHGIPRDPATTYTMAKAVRDLINRSMLL